MTTNEQFARACNQLEGEVEGIEIIIHQSEGEPDLPSSILVLIDNTDIRNSDIYDEEMDVDGWRKFGKSIKTSNKVNKLWLQMIEPFQGIAPEIVRCLHAFFEEIKENKTVEEFHSDDVCTAIPTLDLRYFFQKVIKRTKQPSLRHHGNNMWR